MNGALNNIYRDRLLPGESLVDPYKQCRRTPVEDGCMATIIHRVKLVATGALALVGMSVKLCFAYQITQHNERVKEAVIQRRHFVLSPQTTDPIMRLPRAWVIERIDNATKEYLRYLCNIFYHDDGLLFVQQVEPNPRWALNDPTRPFFG